MERGRIEMDSSAAPSEERGRVEMDPVVGQGESALRGAAQGASLGFADELAGGGEALLDKLRGAHEALGELYLKHRDESRAKYKAAEEANPGTYMAGQIGGGLATAAIPGLGAGGLVAQGLKMGALGAVAGAGASEAQDARELVKDAAVSGLVGGATGVAVGGVARGLGRVAEHLAPTAQGAADRLTVASAGIRGAEDVGATAAALRETGVATPLTTPASAAKRLATKIGEAKEQMVSPLHQLDQEAAAMGPRAVEMGGKPVTLQGSEISGNSIAAHLEDSVLAPLRASPNRTGAEEATVGRVIRQYRELGDAPISFDQADQLAREAAGNAKFNVPGSSVQKDIAGQIKQHLLDKAQAINPELAAARQEAGARASQLYNLQDQLPAQPAATGRLGAMKLAGGAALLHGNIPAAVGAFGASAAKKYVPGLLGAGLDKIAKAAQNPNAAPALGKWATYLVTAAQRGPGALAVAHYTAAQTDGAYAAAARDAMEQ